MIRWWKIPAPWHFNFKLICSIIFRRWGWPSGFNIWFKRWPHLARICLEALDPLVSQSSQLGGVVLLVHQVLLVVDRHVLALGELLVHLLPEAEGPVEGGTVVVAELGAGNLTSFFSLLSL